MAVDGCSYPLPVALAYLFLCSYLANRIFTACRLPGAVGTIFAGFSFRLFMQDDILTARDTLQELAFFLVLLTAGFEITVPDLSRSVFVMSFCPILLEMTGVTLYAILCMGYNLIQGVVLASALCCLGNGLVIPKMKDFMKQFPGHNMPRLIFTLAPLEASLTLTLAGILEPLAHPEGIVPSRLEVSIIGNVAIIFATFLGACCLGSASAKLVMHRDRFAVMGKQVFTGTTEEAYLIILSVALFAFGCGHMGRDGEPWIPLVIAPRSMFQPELLVIATGSVFRHLVSEEVFQSLEITMSGVWVFGQLVLFSMLGSKTNFSILRQICDVMPIIFCSIACRFLGVLLAMALVQSRLKRPRSAFLPDVIFCFTSTLPRAGIQGALGGVPWRKRYFHDMQSGHEATVFIAVASRIYIVFFSIVGSILVDTVGAAMLRATSSIANQELLHHMAEERLSVAGSEMLQVSPRASDQGADPVKAA